MDQPHLHNTLFDNFLLYIHFFYSLLKTTPFLQPPSLHLLKYAAPKFINTLLVTSN